MERPVLQQKYILLRKVFFGQSKREADSWSCQLFFYLFQRSPDLRAGKEEAKLQRI
jgi:hypothetical protein